MTDRRVALVVGIDGYPDRPATGCCGDAKELSRLLARNADESPNWHVETLLGRTASVPVARTVELAARLERHFSHPEDADLLFYFSGHARRSGLGVELCSQDGTDAASGISLDSLMTLVRGACANGARSVTVILDCCFAGQFGSESEDRDDEALTVSLMPDNVVVLASSRPDQQSTQGVGHSEFTSVLLDGLAGAAADVEGLVNALSLFTFAQRAAPARGPHPQLRANCNLLPTLRHCVPAVAAGRLREIVDYFDEPTCGVRLADAFTWDGGPLSDNASADARRYALLWDLRNAGLIEADSPGTLRWVAEHHGEVRLTLRGRFYWQLVSEGRA